MILELAPVDVTSGHTLAAGGFTSPFSLWSRLELDVVGGALMVALLKLKTCFDKFVEVMLHGHSVREID